VNVFKDIDLVPLSPLRTTELSVEMNVVPGGMAWFSVVFRVRAALVESGNPIREDEVSNNCGGYLILVSR